jgi:hypothetical protein
MVRKKKAAPLLSKKVQQKAELKLIQWQLKKLEIEIKQASESWWKKNVLALAALIISLIPIFNPSAAKRPEVYLVHPQEYSQPLKRGDKRDDLMDGPPLYPPLPEAPYKSNQFIFEQSHEHLGSVRALGTQKIIFKAIDIIDKSEDPVATKTRMIERLEGMKGQHKVLVEDEYVEYLIDMLKKA